jgi:hypothetical protein
VQSQQLLDSLQTFLKLFKSTVSMIDKTNAKAEKAVDMRGVGQ